MEKTRTRFIGWLFALAIVPSLYAQNFAGDWQGTAAFGAQDLRIVIRILQEDGGGLKATAYNPDQGGQPAEAPDQRHGQLHAARSDRGWPQAAGQQHGDPGRHLDGAGPVCLFHAL